MSSSANKSCVGLLSIVFLMNYASSEWFSSIGQMEDLLRIDLDLLSSLREYIHAEQTRIQQIQSLADQYEEEFTNAQFNIVEYLGHPINQYQLVNQFVSKWSAIKSLVTKDETSAFLSHLSSKRQYFPNEIDKMETAKAIMRLQDAYELDTHEIAQGSINGLKSSHPLTPNDCFYIGRTAFLEKDYYHCALWMNEVSLFNEMEYKSFTRFYVLEHLSFCMAQERNFQTALNITSEMLKMQPFHKRLLKKLYFYRRALEAQMKRCKKDNIAVSVEMSQRKSSNFRRERYEWLCHREKNVFPSNIEKLLKCYYWTNNNHPRLILQPVKLEEMWDSPHLVRFYDVISDHDINVIHSLAKPLLRRSTVVNTTSGALVHASYRVSKSAWLKNDQSQTVAKVNQRISDITGLSMKTAEFLQIANYGMGGQYESHYDFAQEGEMHFKEWQGNRIASFLIYTSDVSSGGNTVFPIPGVVVRPIKGSAAFWYNLFPSGEGDFRTLHAACPVLVGIKWVSNKWIHERGQEFRRKCRLKRYADNRLF